MICAAMSDPEQDDCYIDDRLHYQLSVMSRAIVADVDHENNGLWHWIHEEDYLLRVIKESGAAQLPLAPDPSTMEAIIADIVSFTKSWDDVADGYDDLDRFLRERLRR